MSKPNENIQFMADVATDIIKIKYYKDKTFEEHLELFYEVMRKYGIKQGTKEGAGVTCNNPEWSMCRHFFMAHYDMQMNITTALRRAPEDLYHY